MKIIFPRSTDGFVKLLFITLAISSLKAQAVIDSRVDKWEFFLAPQFTNSKVLQFDGGAEADINERSSLGFGFGYNVNANVELDVQFSSSTGNYTATAIPVIPVNPIEPLKSSTSLYTSNINFGFTYNILSTPFTPYVSASLGYTYIDSGIPTGDIGNYCYYYPYYGYVCTPIAKTYTSSEFNYGAGIGLRYDFNRKVYIKGDVNQNYLDINSSNTADFTTYRFIFGFMF